MTSIVVHSGTTLSPSASSKHCFVCETPQVWYLTGLNDRYRINGRIELMSLCLRTCNMVMWTSEDIESYNDIRALDDYSQYNRLSLHVNAITFVKTGQEHQHIWLLVWLLESVEHCRS